MKGPRLMVGPELAFVSHTLHPSIERGPSAKTRLFLSPQTSLLSNHSPIVVLEDPERNIRGLC
jgi:hypothetical protein